MTVRMHISGPVTGRWMVERLGVYPRYQHFVTPGTQVTCDRDGFPEGYLAFCGALAIPASSENLALLPVCFLCGNGIPPQASTKTTITPIPD